MTQPQLPNLQDALNQLLQGNHEVLLDPNIKTSLPETMLGLIKNQKITAVERLLEQIRLGSQKADKNVQQAASSVLIAISTALAQTQHWDILDKNILALKKIAGNQACNEELRIKASDAAQMAQSRKSILKNSDSTEIQKSKSPLTLKEEQIFQLAAKGDKDLAKKQLFDLVVTCARKKDFSNAERLRDRIYEIDPMALTEIIQSGDIIEEEKAGSISKDHLEIWTKLLTILSREEFNALTHEMEKRSYKPGEIIVAQGTKNDELFFIDHGSVKVSYTGGEEEIFLTNLGIGEIAGENFFNSSVWTVSLTAQKQTSISALKREKLTRLERQYPRIESQLSDYYNHYSEFNAVIKKTGINRRFHKRFKVETKISLQLFDNQDRILNSFWGKLTDISNGGLSYFIRITKKENSRLLLGLRVKASVPVKGGHDKSFWGTIIGVQAFDPLLSNYSVHVKFLDELTENDLKPFLA